MTSFWRSQNSHVKIKEMKLNLELFGSGIVSLMTLDLVIFPNRRRLIQISF